MFDDRETRAAKGPRRLRLVVVERRGIAVDEGEQHAAGGPGPERASDQGLVEQRAGRTGDDEPYVVADSFEPGNGRGGGPFVEHGAA